MKRATAILHSHAAAGRPISGTITLARADRFKRRIALTTDSGDAFLLDLPEATYLANDDALVLDDGSLIVVKAATEPLMEIHADDTAALARIAWHIGNRHTPAEVTSAAIYIQPDHVLEAMVIGLGAHVHHVMRPFEPEGGAYGGKGPLKAGHGHSHHDHGDHSHAHPHAHDHEPVMPVRSPAVWRPD